MPAKYLCQIGRLQDNLRCLWCLKPQSHARSCADDRTLGPVPAYVSTDTYSLSIYIPSFLLRIGGPQRFEMDVVATTGGPRVATSAIKIMAAFERRCNALVARLPRYASRRDESRCRVNDQLEEYLVHMSLRNLLDTRK